VRVGVFVPYHNNKMWEVEGGNIILISLTAPFPPNVNERKAKSTHGRSRFFFFFFFFVSLFVFSFPPTHTAY
jgi:hypothetical protein